MATPQQEPFQINTNRAIDTRLTHKDIAARNSIDPNARYNGLTVYITDLGKNYQLQGGITDNHWVELPASATGAGGPQLTQAEKNALAGTSGTPDSSNRYVTNSDSRMTDARTPASHAITAHTLSAVAGQVLRANTATSAVFTTLSHNDLSDKGNSSHAAIDMHMGSRQNPHQVTKAQVGLGNVLDIPQISAEEKGKSGGVATLNDMERVEQEPANCSASTQPNVIVKADGNGKIDPAFIQTFDGGKTGLVPVSQHGDLELRYLRSDGTWDFPSGGSGGGGLTWGDIQPSLDSKLNISEVSVTPAASKVVKAQAGSATINPAWVPVMVGATVDEDGAAGLVPRPERIHHNKFLSGAGWTDPPTGGGGTVTGGVTALTFLGL